MKDSRGHLPELDWLKGFAILAVICIHAKLYSDSLFFLQVINRAVHVFLVLFGISSELWWDREQSKRDAPPDRAWYSGRLLRIVPGYWAMTVIWWLVVATWQPPPGGLTLGVPQALLSFLSYAPWIGTSWFVTIILQYVLLFPLLRRVTRLVHPALCLLGAAAATFASCWFLLQIVVAGKALLGDNVPWPGWYYQWIFFPRVLWDVVAGIFVARLWRGRVSVRATLLAAALTVLGVFVAVFARESHDKLGPVREMAVAHLVDVPLSIALLGFFRFTPLPGFVRDFLTWCGLRSWGIYLGHLLLHELVHIAGFTPFASEQSVRALYALGLFAGGAVLVVIASQIERSLRAALSRRAA
jgi:peptidoglycan/LPS O-acetylase OafA/YrhL